MTAFEKIRTKLAEHPGVTYTETPTSIEVHPSGDSGFSVSLHAEGDSFIVFFEGWHEHFDSEGDALDCFAFGLSDACRLVVEYRGLYPMKWVVESQQDGEWHKDGVTALLFFPFWRTRRLVRKQNCLWRWGGPGEVKP